MAGKIGTMAIRIDSTSRSKTHKYLRERGGSTDKRSFAEVLNQKIAPAEATQTPSFEAPGSLVKHRMDWGNGPMRSSRGPLTPPSKPNEGKTPDSLIGIPKNALLQGMGESQETTAAFFPRPISGHVSRRLRTYSPMIEKYSQQYGVDPTLVAGVIKQESGYNPNAVSRAGAMGLMQLMPGTARAMGVSDPFDPEQNIRGGVKFLRKMLDRFGGNQELALAAYNAGPLAVEKYGNRVPPYAETRHYVKAVAAHVKALHLARAFNPEEKTLSLG